MAVEMTCIAFVQQVPETEQRLMVVENSATIRNAIAGLGVNIKHMCGNTCSIWEAGARSQEGGGAASQPAAFPVFLCKRSSHYLASTGRPLAEAVVGLRGPGSRSVDGEPSGLFSLFSRL